MPDPCGDGLHPRDVAGKVLAYLLPCAIGGKSASLLTVFLPACSPPLSRNIASATAITAPNMAPSVPFRALLSLIINSDHQLRSSTPIINSDHQLRSSTPIINSDRVD